MLSTPESFTSIWGNASIIDWPWNQGSNQNKKDLPSPKLWCRHLWVSFNWMVGATFKRLWENPRDSINWVSLFHCFYSVRLKWLTSFTTFVCLPFTSRLALSFSVSFSVVITHTSSVFVHFGVAYFRGPCVFCLGTVRVLVVPWQSGI